MKLFICNCHGQMEIPQELDFGEDVTVHVESALCTEKGKKRVESILNHDEKMVVAGCSPRIVEKFLSEYEPEIVNIREQAFFVGHGWSKMRNLIEGAIQKVRVSKPVSKKEFPVVHKSALVIGAGISGLEASRLIAQSGFQVHLVEHDSFLGGVVSKLDRLYPKGTPNSHTLYPLVNAVAADPRLRQHCPRRPSRTVTRVCAPGRLHG